MSEISGFKKIIATFEIITPMFIGDGLQQPDSVRPTSVKGALRFWWRALIWPQLMTAHQTTEKALVALHQQEVILFGGASSKKGEIQIGGQGLVSVRVFDKEGAPKLVTNWPKNANTGSGYITYGLLGEGEDKRREALQEGHQFIVQLNCRKITPDQEEELKNTLILFGRMGSLGARARRANGCVQIIDLDKQNLQLTKEEYQHWVSNIFQEENNYPPFTALNQHCLAKSLPVQIDARRAHAFIGDTYKNFRSGDNKKIKGLKKEKLGLPLGKNTSRRASPIFLHIYKLNKEMFLPIILFFPAEFDQTGGNMTNCYTPILPLLQG